MSGLTNTNQLAVSSKVQIANLLFNVPFEMKIGDKAPASPVVNPTLGNSLQMEWDSTGHNLIIHNDYPIYQNDGTTYWYVDSTNPALNKIISLSSFTTDKYNHLFLISTVTPNVGNISPVLTTTPDIPTAPTNTIVYIGYVFVTTDNKIIVSQYSDLIDNKSTSVVSSIVYLDEEKNAFTQTGLYLKQTNIIQTQAVFGPGLTFTIKEVGLFMNGSMFAYTYLTPTHTMLVSESIKLNWNLTI